MRAKHENGQGNYTTIATKLSPSDKAKIEAVAQGFGLTFYQLLQGVCIYIARSFDHDNPVTYESNTLVNAFENILSSLKDSYNPVSLTGQKKERIVSAIYFVERQGCKRPQLLKIDTDSKGRATETLNYDKMLSHFLRAVDNDVLQALYEEKANRGYFSLLHTLRDIVLERIPIHDQMANEIAEMFTDIRIGTGEKLNDEVFYRKRHECGRNGESCIIPLQHQTVLAEL